MDAELDTADTSDQANHHRTTLVLAGIWMGLTCLRFLFYHEINERLWIGSLLIDGLLFLFALAVVLMAIISAKHPQRRLMNLAHIKSLFGGDMRSVRHLWGNWYYCSFT